MIVLAVETSGATGSVAIRRAGALEIETVTSSGRGHGPWLLGAVDAALRHVGLGVEDVELFAASAGPGSFTGVRVGLATMAALAWARRRPVTAVESLEALAWCADPKVDGAGVSSLIAPVLDARRQEVYGALFRRTPVGLERLAATVVEAPGRFAARIAELAGPAPVQWLGSGVSAFPGVFPGVFPEGGPQVWIRAAAVASIAEQRAGEGALAPAVPAYVRPAEAEVKFGPAPAHDPVGAMERPLREG